MRIGAKSTPGGNCLADAPAGNLVRRRVHLTKSSVGLRFCRQTRAIGFFVALFTVLTLCGFAHSEPTVEELKAKVASTSIADRPHLCVQIAQKQLEAADKLYAASDVDQAQTTLSDVVAYSELARDYAIQSHKYQKQSEIAVRRMTRKLNEIMHSLGQADQMPVKDAVGRLEQVRNDLLSSMFKKVHP